MAFSLSGSITAEKASPIEEYVQSSTAETRAPSATGKVDLVCLTSRLCSTMALRSPLCSVAPCRNARVVSV